jgi:hypothetical protein
MENFRRSPEKEADLEDPSQLPPIQPSTSLGSNIFVIFCVFYVPAAFVFVYFFALCLKDPLVLTVFIILIDYRRGKKRHKHRRRR